MKSQLFKSAILSIILTFIFISEFQICESQVVPIANWIQSFFGSYEEPDYTRIRSLPNGIEQRTYPPQKWICTEEFLTAARKDGKTSEMFMSLFSYIEGKNEKSQRIAMTVPILTKVDHRNGDLNAYEMCLYLPMDFQESPPAPLNPKVKILPRAEMTVYAMRFGNYANEKVFTDKLKELSDSLKSQGLSYVEEDMGPRALHFNAIYDYPAKFWDRRNEVWLLVPATS